MLFNSFVLALFTFISIITLWMKFPPWFKRLVLKFPLFFDIVVSIGTYLTFGGTATALLATAFLDFMLVVTFHFGEGLLLPKESNRKDVVHHPKMTVVERDRKDFIRIADSIFKNLIKGVGMAYHALQKFQEMRQLNPPRLSGRIDKAGRALPPVTGEDK